MPNVNPSLNAYELQTVFRAAPELPKNPSHLAHSPDPFFLSFG